MFENTIVRDQGIIGVGVSYMYSIDCQEVRNIRQFYIYDADAMDMFSPTNILTLEELIITKDMHVLFSMYKATKKTVTYLKPSH